MAAPWASLCSQIVTAARLLRRGKPGGVAVGVVWTFENLWNISRYMGDARAQELPLIGGDEHDWLHIFSQWGWLAQDTTIAVLVATIAWIGMLAPAGWIVWLKWRSSLLRARAKPASSRAWLLGRGMVL